MSILLLLVMMGGGGSRREISIPIPEEEEDRPSRPRRRRRLEDISIPTSGVDASDISIPTIWSPELEPKTVPAIALMSAKAPFPLPVSGLESPMEPSPASLSTQGENSSAASLAEVKT